MVTKSTVTEQIQVAPVSTMIVDSVNSEEVYEVVQAIKPDLLVVWGSTILHRRLLAVAGKAINLHFGLCPYYRGAVANQSAVLLDDFERVGATIHYINGKADAGDIIATETLNQSLPQHQQFCDLNDRAIATYLKVISEFVQGVCPSGEPQDISESYNMPLREWQPSVRYVVGKKVQAYLSKTR
jgi:methionyl-tRNA formyltransferase